jgi:hypothetical protein
VLVMAAVIVAVQASRRAAVAAMAVAAVDANPTQLF